MNISIATVMNLLEFKMDVLFQVVLKIVMSSIFQQTKEEKPKSVI